MKKLISLLCVALLLVSLMSVTAFADEEEAPAPLENWAYCGITLNSEDLGIASVYYAAEYFTREGILNPLTVEPYTEEELAAIVDGAVAGAEGYVVNVPADAVVGVSAFGMEGAICWFDEENAAKLLSSSDPLVLNTEARELSNLNGEAVASAIPALENWAFAGITLASEDLGIGSVYYTESFYLAVINGELETVNPLTVTPYTSAEVLAILSGAVENAEGYVSDAPEDACVGVSAFGGESICWYDAENAGKILSSSDPLVLNAETGVLSTLAGEAFATPLK